VHLVQIWDRLLDDARADERAAARMRGRWLEQQAAETATFAGTLVDLAEHGAHLSIRATDGRRHDGTAVAVGTDFVALDDRGDLVLVRLATATVVRTRPERSLRLASGDRAATVDLDASEVLSRLAPAQPEVAIGFDGGDTVAGVLLAAGADVLTVRVADADDGIVYASSPRCASVRLRSG
jgi:hypothetical protein